MYLIDTNIFIEILLGQEKADVCLQFLNQATEKEIQCIVTSYTLHSIETILSNLKRLDVLTAFFDDFISNNSLKNYHTSPKEEFEIIQSLSKVSLDFDDALQYYVAKKFNLILVTFDKHFKRVPDIRTYTPR
jgi:predicted nucleic acid-binding protein